VKPNLRLSNLPLVVTVLALGLGASESSVQRQAAAESLSDSECRFDATTFDGWQAQQMTNRWLKLTFVPKLGGRLMQVSFAGHPFLFVNPKYRGQYFPPAENTHKWFNYGGDKIWPMPEGSQDDQHWPGPISDALDDGDYSFHVVSPAPQCAVRLEGPPEARTGLQYVREISIGSGSPQISFHATMQNASTHPIRWSVQAVTQYDTGDSRDAATYNHDFWAFTPANTKSSYLDRYHVRSGLADDPSFSVKNDMFALRWLYLQSEVWIDSPAGWLAVVDGSSQFAIVERFHFDSTAEYPGKATVIFYKNGPAVELDEQGKAVIRRGSDDAPFYLEAELNSPMIQLAPGESYMFNTEWFPTRIGSNFKTATDAGAVGRPLRLSLTGDGAKLSGTFGVFFTGWLVARPYDKQDRELAAVPLQPVDPTEIVNLNQEIKLQSSAEKVSVHLIDQHGVDRGSLGDAEVRRSAPGGS
jgi:hypothetical protein